MLINDTIVALITPEGHGAISVIRISGEKAISLIKEIFKPSKRNINLEKVPSHTIHLGHLFEEEGMLLDQVLISVFRAPSSYTGEEVVEISSHGSPYINKELLELLIRKGARQANPGEFTQRAFLNAKMDLSQAEAVADLIASESKLSHKMALSALKGGISSQIADFRAKLIDFASLIELELDFSEEDVEFANRKELEGLLSELKDNLKNLLKTFKLGNALKNGISVAIIGKPNAGKSSLLNVLVNETKAIVSSQAGTTRDAIEDRLILDGILFRFIDTAGIRKTKDEIENLGIQKTFENVERAQVIFFLFDSGNFDQDEILEEFSLLKEKYSEKDFFLLANKSDLSLVNINDKNFFSISTKTKQGIEDLKKALVKSILKDPIYIQKTLLTHLRHYQTIESTLKSIYRIQEGLDKKIPTDLLVVDIREALNSLGEITGEISSEELLGNIFSKFCIGK